MMNNDNDKRTYFNKSLLLQACNNVFVCCTFVLNCHTKDPDKDLLLNVNVKLGYFSNIDSLLSNIAFLYWYLPFQPESLHGYQTE